MNYQKASQILEINLLDTTNHNTIKKIKKQYHKLALLKHPDKNGNTELSNMEFREIREAYLFLIEIYTVEKNTEEENDKETFCFKILLSNFIRHYLKINDEETIHTIIEIVYKIVNHMENISIHILDQLSQENAFILYSFLSKYKSFLHISNDTLHQLFTMLQQKYNHYNNSTDCFTIHPSIQDIFENNVYQLNFENKIFIVPLWHNEMNFEHLEKEIIVFCQPDLPHHISIDEDNNIIIKHTITSCFLFQLFECNKNIEIELYSNKTIEIPLHNVCFTYHPQKIILKNQGISKIKKDIYDIEDKSNIVIHLIIKA